MWMLLLWLGLGSVPAIAQQDPHPAVREVKTLAARKFGPPADLLNGEKYYYPYGNATGHPYLGSTWTGSLQIRGKTYSDLSLKFEIYNQMLVLEYTDLSDAKVSIVVNDEWLDGFTLGDWRFQKFSTPGDQPRYGQVVFEGKVSCIYFWEKKYAPILQQGVKRYEFSDPIRMAWIKNGSQWSEYSGKRSFLKAFPKAMQEPIRDLLKSKRIRFKKLSEKEMHALMEQINQMPGLDG